MTDVDRDDPCAGFDHDCRSPYYVDRTPYTGGRCALCGCLIREGEAVIDDGNIEMHLDCFDEMPQDFVLKRLGWKKVEPNSAALCAICGEDAGPAPEGYEPYDVYEKDGKYIHSCCFRNPDGDTLQALGIECDIN